MWLSVRYSNSVKSTRRSGGGWRDYFNFPDSLEDEVVQVFDNVERTLATAGASWRNVVHVNSHHVLDAETFDAHNEVMVASHWARRRCESRSASPRSSRTDARHRFRAGPPLRDSSRIPVRGMNTPLVTLSQP